MTKSLLSLPNEILSEIITVLSPGPFVYHKDADTDTEFRKSSRITDLRSLSLTCKHLSTLSRPHFFRTAILNYPTCMIRLLRTLIENPEIRPMVRTLAFCCRLDYCDSISDPFSPRETFVDDNPDLVLNMKWNTEDWDEYAGKVFKRVGLDIEEYKEFTEEEEQELNEGIYWMSIDDWSHRIHLENQLMAGITFAIMLLTPRVERLCFNRYRGVGSMTDFDQVVNDIVKDEELKDKVLPIIKKFEISDCGSVSAWGGNKSGEYVLGLFKFPSFEKLKKVVLKQETKTKGSIYEIWELEKSSIVDAAGELIDSSHLD